MLITPATPLPPYKEELGPRTNSILLIECTGIASQSTPLLKVLFIGTPLSNTNVSVESNPRICNPPFAFWLLYTPGNICRASATVSTLRDSISLSVTTDTELGVFTISSIVLLAVTVTVCDAVGSSTTLLSAACTMGKLIDVKIIENNIIFDVLVCLKLVTVFFLLPFFIFMTLYTNK